MREAGNERVGLAPASELQQRVYALDDWSDVFVRNGAGRALLVAGCCLLVPIDSLAKPVLLEAREHLHQQIDFRCARESIVGGGPIPHPQEHDANGLGGVVSFLAPFLGERETMHNQPRYERAECAPACDCPRASEKIGDEGVQWGWQHTLIGCVVGCAIGCVLGLVTGPR